GFAAALLRLASGATIRIDDRIWKIGGRDVGCWRVVDIPPPKLVGWACGIGIRNRIENEIVRIESGFEYDNGLCATRVLTCRKRAQARRHGGEKVLLFNVPIDFVAKVDASPGRVVNLRDAIVEVRCPGPRQVR